MKNKVAVIGAGNVGASAALYVAERGLADVVLIDRPEMEGMPQGKALDMQQAAPLWHKGGTITGATDLVGREGRERRHHDRRLPAQAGHVAQRPAQGERRHHHPRGARP